MPSWVRRVLPVVAVVGVGVAVVVVNEPGGPDGGGGPTASAAPVSDAELCASLATASAEQDTILSATAPSSTRELKQAVEEAVGLAGRAGLADDVRTGLALAADRASGLADVVTGQDLVEADDDADLGQDRDGDAFAAWVGTACNGDGAVPARYLVPRVTGSSR